MNKPKHSDYSIVSEKLGSNIFFLGSGEVIARLIAYFGITYLASRLGPEHFGIIGLATTIYWYLALSVAGGINDIGSQEVARQPERANSIAANVIIIRFIFALTSLVLVGILALSLDKTSTVKSVIFLTGLLLLPLAFDTSWVFRGLQKNRPIALTLIVSQLLYVGAVFLLVKTPADVVIVPLTQLFGEAVAVLILAYLLFRLGNIQIDLREGIKIVKTSVFRTISLLMGTLTLTFDTILIAFLLGERAVGLYNAPYRLCFLLMAIAAAIHSSYLPLISGVLKNEDSKTETASIANKSIYLSAVVAAPLVVGGMITADLLIAAIFGNEYLEGANALRLLILSVGFIFIRGAIHNILLASNQLKPELIIFAFVAVVNIGLNIFIIPTYGITGAAAVTVLTEFLIVLLGLIIVYKINVPLRLQIIWKPVLASLLMGLILYLVGTNYGLILCLLIGFLTYLFTLIILRGIPTGISQFIKNK